MAAKLLHSLADDNPDLQKQFGCMNGILQIFDRQHMGRGHKGLLPPENSHFNSARLGADSNYANDQGAAERIGKKESNDKQVPAKSSKLSLSPSFPPSSLDKVTVPETPVRDPALTQPIASPKLGRLSVDLRDVVKDSMHRESRGLMKEEGLCQVSKHKNSPRPLRLSKSFNDRSNDLPGDLKESLKLLARLKEAPWYETRDGYPLTTPRDALRYSYDGREMNHLPSESRDFSNTNQRIRDLPRLSLDSRESSIRASGYELDLAYLSKNAQKTYRPPSVVAKLMGLETLPESKPSKVASIEDHGYSMCSSSPRSSRKEPTSPRWKHGDMRPISSSKCPIEPAPWKYLEGGRSPQKQLKSPQRVSNSSPSVYREVERRLKDLEFEHSGKDLRALKQILEAMEAKGLLGTEKDEQNPTVRAKRDEEKSCKDSSRKSGVISASESHRKRRASKTQTSKESCRENAASTSTYRLNSNRNLRVGQNSTKAQPASRDSNVTSPRLQKKLESDKRSVPPTPDSGKSRRQSNQQVTESGGSPGGRRRLKSSIDVEAAGNVRPVKTSQSRILPHQALKCSDISEIRTDTSCRLNEGDVLDELPAIGPEHPSPISVLDASEYGEDSPSPVKQTSLNLEGIGAKTSENDRVEEEWESEDSVSVNHDVGSRFTSEINSKKPGKVDNLAVEKPRQQNANPNEAKSTNPVHSYVLEILSASGLLLSDLNPTFQLHESGHLINPELFFVLEQTKPSSFLRRLDRKLMFDAVNEILALKMASARPPAETWLSSWKPGKKTLNAQKLLRELFEEIELLQASERHEIGSWEDFRGDASGVVLDVERSIFRDLVDEVVIGEAAGLRGKQRKQCRRLF